MKKFNWSAEYRRGTLSELEESDQSLVREAIRSREQAYAPYSRFKVGAALRTSSGEVVIGSNQENAAYPSGLCAERVALFSAGANFPKDEIETLVIYTKFTGELPATSCGSCRQVMSEYESRQNKPIRIIFVDEKETVLIVDSVADLIPFAFHSDRLG